MSKTSAPRPQFDYQGEEQAIMYEIYLPQKYRQQLKKILDEFFDPEQFKNSPEFLRWKPGLPPEDMVTNDDVVRQLMAMVSGYSIYEADGRFGDKNGKPVDEPVMIIRIIIINNDSTISVRAQNVIQDFVTRRLAEELLEDEIWFMRYPNCILNRWVKQ